MDRTTANDFRSNLKEWMELVRTEPVKITQKSGESFVLLNADDFEKIQIELASLRGVARSLSDVVHSRVRSAKNESTKVAILRAKERTLGKKTKKAVG